MCKCSDHDHSQNEMIDPRIAFVCHQYSYSDTTADLNRHQATVTENLRNNTSASGVTLAFAQRVTDVRDNAASFDVKTCAMSTPTLRETRSLTPESVCEPAKRFL